jgi:transposase
MSELPVVVGIAVANARVDRAVRPSGEQRQGSHDASGIAEVVTSLQELAPQVIVLEATGGYDVPVVAELGTAGLAVAVVTPRQVRDCAQASGRLAKTDRLAAPVLAHFAEALHPVARPRPLPDAQGLEWAARVERRRQGVALRTAEQHRLGTTRIPAVRAPIHAQLEWLAADLRALDDELQRRVQASPLWQERAAVLRSAPGGGPIVSLTLLADRPELGQLSHAQIAALVGVAPLNRASGIWRGRRSVWGGRAAVRAALSMATLRATRCHPVIRQFYERLLAAGKAKQVALVACRHKVLTILNAVVRHKTPWQAQAA